MIHLKKYVNLMDCLSKKNSKNKNFDWLIVSKVSNKSNKKGKKILIISIFLTKVDNWFNKFLANLTKFLIKY